MNPSKKSFKLNKTINNMFGIDRESSIIEDKCVACGCSAKEFRNAISKKEYSISGLCQKCQDEVFGVD